MTMKVLGRGLLCFLMAAAVGLGGLAGAEDDPLAPPPGDEGGPPAPGSDTPPAPKAPAKAPADAPAQPTLPQAPAKAPADAPDETEGWGTPDASPTRSVAKDLLPPPLVRNPATGQTRGGSTAASAGDVPSTPLATPPLGAGDADLPPLPTDPIDPALIPGVPRSPAPTAGAPAASTPAGARIRTVTKVHNVRLRDGTPALRLDVEFGATGQRGRSLHLAAGFARADTNATLRSLLPAYAGRAGNVVARTAPVRVQADGRYRASLWIPYGAFPAPGAGRSYDVRAVVQLLRSERGGRETVLSHQDTTFTVHGPQ